MKTYVLLRKNKQEGPFSFEELISMKLESYDLVWKEGQSTHWVYPFEIKELQPFLPPDQFFKNAALINDFKSNYSPQLKIRFQQPVEVLKQRYNNHLNKLNSSFSKKAIYIVGVMAAVFAGLLIVGTVSLKNLFNTKELQVNVPLILSAVKIPPPALPEGSVPDRPLNKHIQNALVTELVVEEKNYELQRKMLHDHWKKQVLITGSDFSFGKNGGIQNLYLTVENKTTLHLRNVKVQVDYLNAKSVVINSQIITIKHIPARSERSWKMRDTDKGVKVKYKVLNIFSKTKKSVFFEA